MNISATGSARSTSPECMRGLGIVAHSVDEWSEEKVCQGKKYATLCVDAYFKCQAVVKNKKELE